LKHNKPFKTGYLKVSDIHEIYYEQSGNPKGKPVFFLHGGPGVGFTANSRQAFDPKKFMVVLYDQRGCARSKPLYETRENTTGDLVEDIEKLRRHLNLGKTMLVGGSWGSTLALAYAETYPENVSSMVLRGTFLGTKEEDDHFYRHGGVDKFFPEVFEKITQGLHEGAKDIDRIRLTEFLKSSDPKIQQKFSRLWGYYEIKISSLEIGDDIVERILDQNAGEMGLATLETHYSSNHWFLKKDQLAKNIGRLKGIPISMVSGRYDMITPPSSAYRIHKLLPNSKLYIVESAGHTDWEPAIAKKMIEAIENYSEL
jgi:proline iminopeptidase